MSPRSITTPGKTAGGKSAATKPRPARPTTARPRPGVKKAGCVSPEERVRLIAEAAYFRAERRGFAEGDALEDWIAAEAEIDALLNSRGAV